MYGRRCFVIFSVVLCYVKRRSADDLAHIGAAAGVGLIGIDVHSGGKLLADTNNDIVKHQLTALAAAGNLDDLLVLYAHGSSILGSDSRNDHHGNRCYLGKPLA